MWLDELVNLYVRSSHLLKDVTVKVVPVRLTDRFAIFPLFERRRSAFFFPLNDEVELHHFLNDDGLLIVAGYSEETNTLVIGDLVD